MAENLITPQELQEELNSVTPPTVLDIRWTLDQPDGSAAYAAGHIPGAVYIDLDGELADLSKPGLGRHPLPSPETVDELLQKIGVTLEDPVVVYDDANRSGSARAWWVLTASGMSGVRILDGGYSGWVAAGGEVATVAPAVAVLSTAVSVPDLYQAPRLPVLDIVAAGERANTGTLLDARATERFAGESNPEWELPGHIPGARSLAGTEVLDEHGFFLSAAELGELFDAAGVTADDPAGAYCGSGITACVVIAAAYSIGREVALFPGSWSQWAAVPEAPVEFGRGVDKRG
ncbi:sulfurtransferase [Corynebacterium sp. A21]|uniref:sulfurtransferase n=1 Tax=Corynebacterium sp. A21 TaxID=3457318 RepID=UPI003FD6AFA8